MENPPYYRSDHSDPSCNVEESEPSIPAIRVLTLRVMISTNRLGSDLSSYELLWSKESMQVLALSRDRHDAKNFVGEQTAYIETLFDNWIIQISQYVFQRDCFQATCIISEEGNVRIRSKIVGNED